MSLHETDAEPVIPGDLDPVTFEVIRHRLWAINDDQARMAARLSGAPIIYEGFDFNAALVSRDGRGLFCGVYIMQHGATIDGFVTRVLDEWPREDIRDGDMFFTNDPWQGALHAPDGMLVMPIFWHGHLVAWSGIVMHDNDTGGAAPGSMVLSATDRFAESPLFPMVRMVEGFEVRKDMERTYLRNSRSPELNRLNMRARVGALRVTRDRINQLVDRYGLDQFLLAQDGMIDYVEKVVSARLRAIPDGSWFASGYVDHDGQTPTSYAIRCQLSKVGDRLTFDFTGTSTQAPGPVNCTLPATEGAVVGVILSALCYDLPWAIGGLRNLVTIVAEPGTLNHANSPAPVSAASVSAVLVTADTVGLAFSKMLLSSSEYRDEAHATWMPSFSGGFFTSLVEEGELGLVAVADMFSGGGGARRHSDGIDTGGIAHSMASRMCNVETIESRAPVLQLYRRELTDAGGAGRFRGGVGLEYGTMTHKTGPGLFMTFASGVQAPGGRGLAGGRPGGAASSVLLRDTDARRQFAAGRLPIGRDAVASVAAEVLPGKSVRVMTGDDVLVTVVGSGSGYGDPVLRDPEAVARDVGEDLVSTAVAHDVYGVVVVDDPGRDARVRVDTAATTARRSAILADRLARSHPVTVVTAEDLGGAALLHPVTDAVDAVSTGQGGVRYRCSRCARSLGPYDGDFKMFALVQDIELDAITPVNTLCSKEFVCRQFVCPGCGHCVAFDVQLRSEEVAQETRFVAG